METLRQELLVVTAILAATNHCAGESASFTPALDLTENGRNRTSDQLETVFDVLNKTASETSLEVGGTTHSILSLGQRHHGQGDISTTRAAQPTSTHRSQLMSMEGDVMGFLWFKRKCDPNADLRQIYNKSICAGYYNAAYRLCWPPELVGSITYNYCPNYTHKLLTEEAHKIHLTFDEAQSEWLCGEEGVRSGKPNYTECVMKLVEKKSGWKGRLRDDKPKNVEHFLAIYYAHVTGYLLSSAAILLALFIFCKFRRLRCLRNFIHSQLLIAILMGNVFLIIQFVFNFQLEGLSSFCRLTQFLYKYFYTAWFMWMFIEGFYIFINVNFAYSGAIKVTHILLLGWGTPLMIMAVWVTGILVNPELNPHWCWYPVMVSGHIPVMEQVLNAFCGIILMANCLFLVVILWVIIKKLRATSQFKQNIYRKAVKATFVLTPLLGLTYALFIFHPPNGDPSDTASKIYLMLHAVFIASQGFWVALAYCFLNEEVRVTLSKSFRKWKDHRRVGPTASVTGGKDLLSILSRRYSSVTSVTRFSRRSLGRVDSNSRADTTESEALSSRRSSRRSDGDSPGTAGNNGCLQGHLCVTGNSSGSPGSCRSKIMTEKNVWLAGKGSKRGGSDSSSEKEDEIRVLVEEGVSREYGDTDRPLSQQPLLEEDANILV